MASKFDDLLRDLRADFAHADEARKAELRDRVAKAHAQLEEQCDAILARAQAEGRAKSLLTKPHFAAKRDAARRLWPAVGYGATPHVLIVDSVLEVDRSKYRKEMDRLAGALAPDLADSRKAVLLRAGRFFWQYCDALDERSLGFNQTQWDLRCPLCEKGTIVRSKDDTPGFKESSMTPCTVCGLTGDGSYLKLDTAKPEHRPPPGGT